MAAGNTSIYEQIEKAKRDYAAFVKEDALPTMKLTPINMKELRRRLAWATVEYDPGTDKYELLIWDQLFHPAIGVDCSYLLFHEFTHALDISKYAAGDQDRYNSIRGYLEYHAAQVEMYKLLGRASFGADEPFSMSDVICPIEGEMTVHEYIEQGLGAVNEGIRKTKSSPSISTIFSTVGAIYNHLGRISICEIAATDYNEHAEVYENRCNVTNLFDTKTWYQVRSEFNGVMTEDQIRNSGELYLSSLYDLFRQYGL